MGWGEMGPSQCCPQKAWAGADVTGPAPGPAPLSPGLPQGQLVHFMNTSVTLQVFLLILTWRDSRFSLLGRELL